ncbi:MAG TPA: peptide chain release factor N(5)-glutamine methyltransferase [Longimicrobiales bacterium]|nr:peptide chain release factor N(5)-glutamine methyltransferase [Longimicrobiales bacterium]
MSTADVSRSARERGNGEAGGDEGTWTVLRLIRWSGEYLDEKGVASGRLDAEHLLAHALGMERLQLYLQFDRPLTSEEREAFKPLLRRRANREPLQYIVGRAAFRELELRCDARALIPRSETELLVDRVLEWAAGRDGLEAVDLGTGTGCIALALASEGPFATVWAVDRSAEALSLARENLEGRGEAETVRLILGEGLAALPAGVRVDAVVSNPPYVREGERHALAPEILEHEPHGALFAGEDGMAVIDPLIPQAADRLRAGGLLALEIGIDQGDQVLERIAAQGGFREARVYRDLTGRPRFVTAVRREDGAVH